MQCNPLLQTDLLHCDGMLLCCRAPLRGQRLLTVRSRSGETEDTTIADLVVGLGTGQIKTGAPCRYCHAIRFAVPALWVWVQCFLCQRRFKCVVSSPREGRVRAAELLQVWLLEEAV